MIGRTISHYKIIEKLGAGGMGEVYKAEDLKLQRIVALKFLPFELTRDEKARKRFLNEARAASALDHHNIGSIHGIDEVDGQSFIAMAYYQGKTLKEKIEQGPLEVEEAVDIAIKIAQGLAGAHIKGIVHRDIKPANVLITEDGQVKIIDFGLAKLVGLTMLTRTGSTMGTVAYMSPEQVRGESVDQSTDIWSFGVVLYEMLTGQLPFKGDYQQAVSYSILNENPEPLQKLRPDAPAILDEIVNKALAKNRSECYQNCEQLLHDLQSHPLTVVHDRPSLPVRENTEPATKENIVKNLQQVLTAYMKTVRISSKRFWMISAAVTVLAAVGIYIFMPVPPSTKVYSKKIAVLPFTNMSNNLEDEYFSDGITEDILAQLVKIGDLRVISRTTMMQYKGSNKKLREIGKELNADVILEGSVRYDADQVRITAQLIDADTDEHLWAENYDKEMKQIFIIQSEIAQKIAAALHAKLSPAERDRLAAPATFNAEAYNLILKGGYYLARGSRENVELAIDQFKQALSLDPDNARAWAQLATAYARQADLGALSTEEGYRKARQAAERALVLDDQLAQGHTIMGWIKRSYDWDWVGAEAECRKALELAPGDVTVIRNMANLEKSLGRFDQAIALMQKAAELDPKKVPIYTSLGLLSMYANRLEEAVVAYQKVIELNPQYPPAHTFLGLVYLLQGKADKAIVEIQLESDEGWRLYGLAQAYNGAKRNDEADTALKSLIARYGSESAYQVAEVYAYRGEIDNAFGWLEKAYALRDGGLSELKGDPFMKKIESDQRYVAFLKKMNLPFDG